MTRSLVLNATCEPLCVVSGRRAVCLVLAGKAEVLDDSPEVVRSEHLVLGVPSVVRLRYVVKVPFNRRATSTGGRCSPATGTAASTAATGPTPSTTSCPGRRAAATSGTTWWPRAGRATCAERDRLLEETSMRLARRPAQPRDHSWIVVAVERSPTVGRRTCNSP